MAPNSNFILEFLCTSFSHLLILFLHLQIFNFYLLLLTSKILSALSFPFLLFSPLNPNTQPSPTILAIVHLHQPPSSSSTTTTTVINHNNRRSSSPPTVIAESHSEASNAIIELWFIHILFFHLFCAFLLNLQNFRWPLSLKECITEFMMGATEMTVELGKGCRDIVKQSLVNEDSYIARHFGSDSYFADVCHSSWL